MKIRKTFTLPEELWQRLCLLANLHYEGNVSQTVRILLEEKLQGEEV